MSWSEDKLREWGLWEEPPTPVIPARLDAAPVPCTLDDGRHALRWPLTLWNRDGVWTGELLTWSDGSFTDGSERVPTFRLYYAASSVRIEGGEGYLFLLDGEDEIAVNECIEGYRKREGLHP